MIITELQQLYATHPNVEGMCKLLKDNSVRHLYCSGLCASAASLVFIRAGAVRRNVRLVFILGDLEEAGYFYQRPDTDFGNRYRCCFFLLLSAVP